MHKRRKWYYMPLTKALMKKKKGKEM